MSFSLIPDYLFDVYDQITPEWLTECGVTLLLSDLDFTLAEKKTCHPDQRVRDWIASLHRSGIVFMIVSNNRSGKRVRNFCGQLGVPYQGHAGKPGTRGLREAMSRAHADEGCTAMLGDKLLTDVLAAKRAGIPALMVEPVGGPVTVWQRVLHALQTPFKVVCRRRMRAKTKKTH
jgi:HAD superfamily phosphatase (TIGR01668 family)